ncbi:MAG: MscL family protein [Patescibacteria group bacterium]|nr:MscL family protein [Patescibacteria group bacterium]
MVVREKVGGFIDFVKEQGVVGLAVGFILGGATASVVTSLVADIINPLLGLLGGAKNLSEASLRIGSATIMWGNFASTLINFIIVAAVVYFAVKGLGLDKLDKKKEESK